MSTIFILDYQEDENLQKTKWGMFCGTPGMYALYYVIFASQHVLLSHIPEVATPLSPQPPYPPAHQGRVLARPSIQCWLYGVAQPGNVQAYLPAIQLNSLARSLQGDSQLVGTIVMGTVCTCVQWVLVIVYSRQYLSLVLQQVRNISQDTDQRFGASDDVLLLKDYQIIYAQSQTLKQLHTHTQKGSSSYMLGNKSETFPGSFNLKIKKNVNYQLVSPFIGWK